MCGNCRHVELFHFLVQLVSYGMDLVGLLLRLFRLFGDRLRITFQFRHQSTPDYSFSRQNFESPVSFPAFDALIEEEELRFDH